MTPQTVSPQPPSSAPEFPIYDLYRQLLEAWNNQDAHAFAATFAENGSSVGYDGSIMNGLAEIEMTLSGIFTNHKTASYLAIVREIRFLSPQVALLRAIVGMIPPGKTNSIRSATPSNHWSPTLPITNGALPSSKTRPPALMVALNFLKPSPKNSANASN